jgi:hypothetical protein
VQALIEWWKADPVSRSADLPDLLQTVRLQPAHLQQQVGHPSCFDSLLDASLKLPSNLSQVQVA